MVWTRLPTFFPNVPLRMLPLAPEQLQQLRETGWLREVAFRTDPRVNKLEIKGMLASVYGLDVERVSTINYEGKKKRQLDQKGRPHYTRRPDWKKVYVILKAPEEAAAASEAARAAALKAYEAQRWAAVKSGVGRARYELLPLAVRSALMERRDADRAERQRQQRAERAASSGKGGGGGGGQGGRS